MIHSQLKLNVREKVETILIELSPNIRNEYTSATAYHDNDGKWLAIAVDSDKSVVDIKKPCDQAKAKEQRKVISEMKSII